MTAVVNMTVALAAKNKWWYFFRNFVSLSIFHIVVASLFLSVFCGTLGESLFASGFVVASGVLSGIMISTTAGVSQMFVSRRLDLQGIVAVKQAAAVRCAGPMSQVVQEVLHVLDQLGASDIHIVGIDHPVINARMGDFKGEVMQLSCHSNADCSVEVHVSSRPWSIMAFADGGKNLENVRSFVNDLQSSVLRVGRRPVAIKEIEDYIRMDFRKSGALALTGHMEGWIRDNDDKVRVGPWNLYFKEAPELIYIRIHFDENGDELGYTVWQPNGSIQVQHLGPPVTKGGSTTFLKEAPWRWDDVEQNAKYL